MLYLLPMSSNPPFVIVTGATQGCAVVVVASVPTKNVT